MHRIRHIRRIGAALAGLACAWLGLAAAAPAAFAFYHPRAGGEGGLAPAPVHAAAQPTGSRPATWMMLPAYSKHPPLPAGHAFYTVHQGPVPVPEYTVLGGMPGWQIALIALGAALVAATAAVLAYRAWAARRKPVTAAA